MTSAMKIWLRRLFLVIVVLFWLAIILTPTLAFFLARNGQIQVGAGTGRHWRLFLIQEERSEGLGLERGQPLAAPPDAPDGISCLRTSVSYWMWAGAGNDSSYCQCLDSTSGNLTDLIPIACMTIE